MPIGTEGSDLRTEGADGDGDDDTGDDYDVVIIGGGPSGASAGVFTARAGMRCCLLDRGPSSLARCAYLENYLGFPGGIDVATFQTLCRDHAEAAGCRYVADMVVAIRRAGADRAGSEGIASNHDESEDGGETETESGDRGGDNGGENREGSGFVVETADGRTVKTPRVVAATKDDADYLDALGEKEMFEEGSDDGEAYRYFDSGYVDGTGRTPLSGLYVAGPLGGCLDQAVASAGHGATVGFAVIADWLVSRGYPPGLARGYWDWLSKEKSRDDEWAENTQKFVEQAVPEETSDERIDALAAELRAHTDALFVDREEVSERTRRGHRRLLDRLDDDVIRAYLAEREGST